MRRQFDHIYFFGRFNFPHVGYLYVIRETLIQCTPTHGLTVVFSESKTTWNKEALPMTERLAMFDLLMQELPPAFQSAVHCSSIEAKLHRELGDQYGGYTVDTLTKLVSDSPDQHHAIVMGADAALGIPGHHAGITEWKEWEEILSLATLIIVPRGRYATAQQVQKSLPIELHPYMNNEKGDRILILSTHPTKQELHASSSAIQEGNLSFLPPAVLAYAQEQRLLSSSQ